MAPPPSLGTARLLLRPVAGRDVPELAALLSDPDVFRFLLDGAPGDVALARGIVAASRATFEEHGVGFFLATRREDGAAVGLAGFRRAEVGGLELVCALWPRFWGQGLAQEACRACLDLASERGLAEVLAGADAPNRASLRLIERLGFAPLKETQGAFGVIRWFVRGVSRPSPA